MHLCVSDPPAVVERQTTHYREDLEEVGSFVEVEVFDEGQKKKQEHHKSYAKGRRKERDGARSVAHREGVTQHKGDHHQHFLFKKKKKKPEKNIR